MFATTPACPATPNRPSLRRAEPLPLVVSPSRYLGYFYIALYGALILLSLGLASSGGHYGLLALAVSGGLGVLLRARLRWHSAHHWRIQYDTVGWWLGSPDDELKPARLVGGVRLWRAVAFLTLADERGFHHLVLCTDSASAADLHQLRVWLVTHRSVC